MSTRLSDLIKGGSSVDGVVTNAAFGAALAKRNEEHEKQVTEGLVDLLQEFISQGTAIEREAEAAAKNSASLRKSADEAKLALDYFGETGNPLPFFATYSRCDGRRWCEENGIDVPADKDSAWSVPAGWAAGQATTA